MGEDVLKVGTLRAIEGGYEGTLERVLEHPRVEVWKVLTEAHSLGKWRASGSIEQVPGGAVKIDFADSGTVIDSRVSALSSADQPALAVPGAGEQRLAYPCPARYRFLRLLVSGTNPSTGCPTLSCVPWP